METKVFGIEAGSLSELVNEMNKFSKGRKVFATQTHISSGIFYAFLYYEYDNQLSNEKPRILNKDNVGAYFGKPNNSPKPTESDNFVPATAKQVYSLVKNYGYKKEDAQKLSVKEAYQIISEKKGRKK